MRRRERRKERKEREERRKGKRKVRAKWRGEFFLLLQAFHSTSDSKGEEPKETKNK